MSPPILGLLTLILKLEPDFSSLDPELDSDSFLGRADKSAAPLVLTTKLIAAGLAPKSGRGIFISLPLTSKRKGEDLPPSLRTGSPNPNLDESLLSLKEMDESPNFTTRSESTTCLQLVTNNQNKNN